jgi:predicted acylesterase/phospholipase RssA
MAITFDLVFEGGGAKGMAFVGALEALLARGHSFGRLLGTSAGAMMATFLAAGFSPAEMKAVLAEKDENGVPVLASFLARPVVFPSDVIQNGMFRTWLRTADIPLLPAGLEERFDDYLLQRALGSLLFRHIFSFVEIGGWYAADAYVAWLSAQLNQAWRQREADSRPERPYSQMTLTEFHTATGVDLTLLAANTTDSRLLVLNHRTAPDCPVVQAIRMSSNMPFLWPEIVWPVEWGLYQGEDISGRVVVDGGLISNFPLELFITTEWEEIMGESPGGHLIGLLLDEMLVVPGAPPPGEEDWTDILAEFRPVERVNDLVETATSARDNGIIAQYADFVVHLPAATYRTTEFGMSDARREALIQAAFVAMNAYLDGIGAEPPTVRPAVEAADFYAPADYCARRILG